MILLLYIISFIDCFHAATVLFTFRYQVQVHVVVTAVITY